MRPIDVPFDHVRNQIIDILAESWDQGGEIRAKATAFSFMKGIIEDGRPMSHQIRDLEELVLIFRKLVDRFEV
jgi:hypothetical protein